MMIRNEREARDKKVICFVSFDIVRRTNMKEGSAAAPLDVALLFCWPGCSRAYLSKLSPARRPVLSSFLSALLLILISSRHQRAPEQKLSA